MVKKLKLVEQKNGKHLSEPPAVATSVPADLTLNADEEATVRSYNLKVAQAKTALADVSLQIHTLEMRRQQLVGQVQASSNALIDAVKVLARARGVDPDKPPAPGEPRLHFDLDTFRFSRVGSTTPDA